MTWTFTVTNIAGILDAEVELQPGLNAIKASNWQGKSSFLEAIMTALGVSKALTEGRTTGAVSYTGPECSGEVTLSRVGKTVERSGNPILEAEYDVIRADLFACLGEQNEVRQRVREGKKLESVLLRPLDFENIDEQIQELKRERKQLESELERAQNASQRLPSVESEIAEIQAELSELKQEYEQLENNDDEKADAQSQLASAESDRKQIQNKISRLEDSISRAETKLEQKEDELSNLTVPDSEDIDSELTEAQNELERINRDKQVLESIHSSTEMILQHDRLDLITDVTREIEGDKLVCWTCGSDTSRETVESQLAELRSTITELKTQADEQQSRVETLETKRERISQSQRRQETLEADIAELKEKISTDKQSLETARKRLETVEEKIDELSDAVDESRNKRTDIESKIKYRKTELQNKQDTLEKLEERAARLDNLESQQTELTEEIKQLRERKDRVRRETRERFDATISEIVSRLDTGFETARLTSEFELVVARDGRESALTALSEGERELLGFAAALAGYQTFDVEEISPFILVDQVGGLAGENVSILVEYLAEQSAYTVFTSYPEQANSSAHTVQPSEWKLAHQ